MFNRVPTSGELTNGKKKTLKYNSATYTRNFKRLITMPIPLILRNTGPHWPQAVTSKIYR